MLEGSEAQQAPAIPSPDLRDFTSPQYFPGRDEADLQLAGLSQRNPNCPLVFMPRHAAFAQFTSLGEYAGQARAGTRREGQRSYPAAIAPYGTGQEQGLALLVSEFDGRSMAVTYEGELLRVDPLENIRLIAKYGLLQLPGRISFTQGTGDEAGYFTNSNLLRKENHAVLAFDVRKTDHVAVSNGTGTLKFDPANAGETRLPEEIAGLIPAQLIRTHGETAWKTDVSLLRNQVLQLGSITGLLQHLPRERINGDRTIRINRLLSGAGLVPPRILSALESMLSAEHVL